MQSNFNTKLRGLVRLSRWREYVTFVIPCSIAGALLAISITDQKPDLRLIAVTLANILVVAYAFMINDIEDAPDDALEEARKARNPIACGEISSKLGWAASLLVAALTLLLYALCGSHAFAIGLFCLIISHLYSWKPVRLKGIPVLDVISHALMLSGLLMLAGYLTYDAKPGWVWLPITAIFFGSAHGQLYNQLRDFNMDKAAGLHNTAITIGEQGTRRLMWGLLVLAIVCAGIGIVLTLVTETVPVWLIAFALIIAPVIFLLLRPKTDMRGSETADFSGTMQIPLLVWVNVVYALWTISILAGWA